MYSLLAFLFERFQLDVEESYLASGSLFVNNPDVLCEQFAGLVIQRGLPFNHFDDEQTTRVFQKHLQPKYNHVSRTTLKLTERRGRRSLKMDDSDEDLLEAAEDLMSLANGHSSSVIEGSNSNANSPPSIDKGKAVG
nr:zinc finger C2H2-type/integrase DNA-binding domain-containing protein [Tanacetum cinerariifolium]